MLIKLVRISLLLVMLPASTAVWAEAQFGKFKGEIVVKFLPDGRNVSLEKPFGFVDPDGQSWDVPAGARTNGASIPRAMWSIIGAPFTGKYRNASVIHDYYCNVRTRSWKDTHKVFYSAMRAAGVTESKAKTLFAAVYFLGPRWDDTGQVRDRRLVRWLPDRLKERIIKKIEAWIAEKNPPLEVIIERMERDTPFDKQQSDKQ